jgi:hypothetical protein
MGACYLGAIENCRFPIPFLDGKSRYSILLQQNRVYVLQGRQILQHQRGWKGPKLAGLDFHV